MDAVKYRTLNILIGVIVGLLISLFLYYGVVPENDDKTKRERPLNNDEVLYWVAPMDPNFKRDKPGKSPMGMDLVPVYVNELSQKADGTITIDPVTIQNMGVKTALVSRMQPTINIRAFGRVEYAQNRITHIHARVEGWIETLYVGSEGDFVEKGRPLYALYSPALVNAQEELIIALKQANASLIDAAQSRLEALNVPLSFIHELKQNKKVQRTIIFTSPHSGFIKALQVQEGFFVTPSNTMLSIAPLNTVWVIASVVAQQANLIELGQTAIIHSEFIPNTPLAAKIEYIYPSLHPKTHTLQVRFTLPNPKLTLKPNMFVDVFIDAKKVNDKTSVLAIPTQALIRTGTQSRVVLALGEGKFKSIEVFVGRVFGDYYEITEGLKDGDRIVTSAQFLLDSESNISSDFNRMTIDAFQTQGNSDVSHTLEDGISEWTSATVVEVFKDKTMIRLEHGPLAAFNMMGMTMNFTLAEHLDINLFAADQNVHVEIVKTPSGMCQVNTLHVVSDDANNQRTTAPVEKGIYNEGGH